MKLFLLPLAGLALLLGACIPDSQESKDQQAVNTQQSQYAKAQPVPFFNWSLEREMLTQLYHIRNAEVATHSVWRAAMGMIEGDCPSMGFGLPYDASLTNPLMATDENPRGHNEAALTSIGQPEPNGIFASTNTSATWVMCVGPGGTIEPVYVETKVTVYPGPVTVDYTTGRVERVGDATVTME